MSNHKSRTYMPVMNHSGSVLIATDKEIIYKKCFGYADIAKKLPITFETQFLTGSVTKQFAAVAILKALYDKDKNNIKSELNKPIEYYLPKKNKIWDGTMPAWASKITLHQLLVHSSGIPNYTNLPEFENQKFLNSCDVVSFFKNQELEFIPGEKFSYSNSGYYLLGIIIEEITQQKLDSYLENTFFKPLVMKSTYLPMKDTVDELIKKDVRFSNLARGYEYEITAHNAALEEVKRYERMETPGMAGALISTAEDLLKWNNALYAEKIIPQSLLELMLHPYLVTERIDAYYGYGIEIMNSEVLGTYFTHRGGIPGFRSILTYIPSLKLSIITMQNIVANQDKIMPEIKEIQASLPPNLSREESTKQLVEIIEAKYPKIVENRERFEFASIYEAVIKVLETTESLPINNKSVQWGYEYLSSHGHILKSNRPETVKNTPWSQVTRFSTSDGYIYLKHMPKLLALEAPIIKILRDRFHAAVPEVIADNTELSCFLMKDAGKPLRDILKKQFDTALFCKAIAEFTALQSTVADHVNIFIDIGVPDFRLDKLPDLYKKLIAQKDMLIADGLSEKEICELENHIPTVVKLCKNLADYSIKETIVQPDFHDNNILIGEISQNITIIDLGEIVISHPFFSLINCLYQIKRHHALTDNDARFLKIKNVCFKNYIPLYIDRLSNAFKIAEKLLHIFGALCSYRLIIACDKSKFTGPFQRHGKHCDSLKEFLKYCAIGRYSL